MTELSAYVPEPIREGPDITLYRGRQYGNLPFMHSKPLNISRRCFAARCPTPVLTRPKYPIDWPTVLPKSLPNFANLPPNRSGQRLAG